MLHDHTRCSSSSTTACRVPGGTAPRLPLHHGGSCARGATAIRTVAEHGWCSRSWRHSSKHRPCTPVPSLVLTQPFPARPPCVCPDRRRGALPVPHTCNTRLQQRHPPAAVPTADTDTRSDACHPPASSSGSIPETALESHASEPSKACRPPWSALRPFKARLPYSIPASPHTVRVSTQGGDVERGGGTGAETRSSEAT